MELGQQREWVQMVLGHWDTQALPIPTENTPVVPMPPDINFDSNSPFLAFPDPDTSLLLEDGPQDCEKPVDGGVSDASSAQDSLTLADQWLCERPNCNRAFNRRYELK